MAIIERICTITGGRHYRNRDFVHRTLRDADPDLIVHGGAKGADTLADEWAQYHGIPRLILSVTDRQWKLFGKPAGRYRNAELADIAKQLIDPLTGSFGIAYPGDDGTANMLEEMLTRELAMRDFRDDPEALT